MYIKLEKCDFKLSDVSNMSKLEFKKLEKNTSLKSEGNLKSIKKEPGVNYLISPRRIRKIKDEKKDVKFKIITGFIPPKSPHNLIEEQLWNDPWALLIATIFLNRTSCQIARPYVFWFLNDNPNPSLVLEKNVNDLEIYFRALGLQITRAKQVWRMSYDYIYKNWKRVGELYGVGRYGEDAFRMFCLGDFTVEPKDRYLKIYKAWYEMNEKNERIKEMNC
ncbi:methyl-CpG-binding domain protein 4-like isoform X2 [Rhynchophorus ferrugineus]